MTETHDNPPEAASLAYRIGTHASFLRRMLERLPRQTVPPGDRRPLETLTTRDPSDPAIALLDAWAVVADVLTFYQERIANEGYLRSATERRSLEELARAADYEPQPGVAASTPLAFFVEQPPGTQGAVRLEPGIKVQSIPADGQLPQVFETIEAIEARPEWNEIRARPAAGTSQPGAAGQQQGDDASQQNKSGQQRPAGASQPDAERSATPPAPAPPEGTGLRLAGGPAGLRPGDWVLVVDGTPAQPCARQLKAVTRGPGGEYTDVTWDEKEKIDSLSNQPQVYVFRQRVAPFGRSAPRPDQLPPEQRPVDGGLYALKADGTWISLQRGLPAAEIRALAGYRRDNVDYFFAAVAGGGVYRSRDGGKSWQMCSTNLADEAVYSLFVDSHHHLYAGASNGTIYRSTSDGDSWTQLTPERIIERIKTVVGTKDSSGKITPGETLSEELHTTRPGLPVSPIRALVVDSSQAPDPNQSGLEPTTLLAATDRSLYRSTDGGASWAAVGINDPVSALAFDGSKVYLLISNELKTLDSIATATGLNSPPAPLTSVVALGQAGTVLWAATKTEIKTLQPGATTWIAHPSNAHPALASHAFAALGDANADAVLLAATPPKVLDDWPGLTIAGGAASLDLDDVYRDVRPDSYALIVHHDGGRLTGQPLNIQAVAEAPRVDFGLSASVSRLSFKPEDALKDLAGKSLRDLEILVQGEPRQVVAPPAPPGAEQQAPSQQTAPSDAARTAPAKQPAAGGTGGSDGLDAATSLAVFEADGMLSADLAGRRVIVSGQPAGGPKGAVVAEEASVKEATAKDGRTTLTLEAPLRNTYDPETVTIFANVALATHGETVADEVLGSGDGTRPNQRFALDHGPLTFVETPPHSTLSVRVNGVLWDQARSLLDHGPHSHAYVLRRDDQGRTMVVFGDGVRGARLPSGIENVVATYRAGIGAAGNVGAGSLTILQSHPLGATEVVNPLPAAGGADPEPDDNLRRRAGAAHLTLDRIVSLSDYEDFARGDLRVGKAQASLLRQGGQKLVYLTVAGTVAANGDEPAPPIDDLRAAILAHGGGPQLLDMGVYKRCKFGLTARLFVDCRYSEDAVKQAVKTALIRAFSFAARQFGQGVTASEVISVIQAVPGVMGVDLQRLAIAGDGGQPAIVAGGAAAGAWAARLSASPARLDAGKAQPAQLLTIEPEEITLTSGKVTG